jgi:DNA-binding LacI/PurR family transcriptional regulator
MATACGEQMVKLIEGCPIEHRKQVFPTALIVRDSCGANA